MGEPSRNFSDIMKIRSPDFSLSSAKDIPIIPGHHRVGDVIPTADSRLVLQKVPSEFYPKVCNHGEGPY